MRSHLNKIYQQAAYIQAQRLVCLLLLVKYAKSLQESFGANGARLVDADGNILNIPQNTLSGSTPVETKTIAASAVSGIVGSDFTLLRAVQVNFGAIHPFTDSPSIELSIPTPSGINMNLPIVIARAIEVKGATKLKLVALAKISGSLISSSVSSVTSVEGIKASGVYYVLQAKSALGYVQGKVTDASNNPYTSTLVTSNTCCPISGPLGQLNGMKVLDDVCEVRWTCT